MACYNIYRGESPGFEPGPANRVGRVAIDQDTLAPKVKASVDGIH